jgi:hypothetical protein
MPQGSLSSKVFSLIHPVRGQNVLLDRDLAGLYGLPTDRVLQAMRGQRQLFPAGSLFQLERDELSRLREQSAVTGGAGRRPLPWAFTEEGVAVLSGALDSDRAIEVNIAILCAYVRVRGRFLPAHEISKRLDRLEDRAGLHETELRRIFEAIHALGSQRRPGSKDGPKP